MMEWSLCIATLDRQDALIQSLACARQQSCPPSEVVVVDVSENWEDSAVKAEAVLRGSDISLHYQTLGVRSSAVQRNAGIAQCTKEIIFLLDDDSFMFHDCAEEILKIYAADTKQVVAGIAARLVPELPPNVQPELTLERYHTAHSANLRRGSLKNDIQNSRLGRWLIRRILLQSKDETFIRYEGARDMRIPHEVAHLEVSSLVYMPGSAMTVRRTVALAEPFDAALRYYAAGEDIDTTYRYGRHGCILQANSAQLHHYKAAGGRIGRTAIIALQLLNMAVFIKRHAVEPDQLKRRFHVHLHRRLVAEFLKDFLSGRFGFPQVWGVLIAMQNWRNVWARDGGELEEWYPDIQRKILEQS